MGKIQKALKALVAEKKELGLISQSALAEKMNTSPSVISSLLSGDRRLHEDQILKICEALGVSLADLEGKKPVEVTPEEHADIYRKLRVIFRKSELCGKVLRTTIDATYKEVRKKN